jgi:hypothetical protein
MPEVTPNDGEQTTQQHPEDTDQSQEFGENNVELPEQLKKVLLDLFKRFMREEMYERRWEVMTGRRLRFYERGFQHITWADRSLVFQQVTPGMTTQVGSEEVEAPNYLDDYNIFQPYLLTRVSVLTQNPPGIDFRPSSQDTLAQQAAADAENYRMLFDQTNDRAALQMRAARFMGVSSRVVAWTRTEANAQRWGNSEDGTPNQREVSTLYGDLETKCRITATCFEETNYFVISTEKNVLDAKAQNPDFKDKIKASEGGIGEENYERIARLGVLQGQKTALAIGDLLKNLVTEHHCWLRPSAFEDEACAEVIDFEYELVNPKKEDPDEDEMFGADVLTVRDVLNDLFLDGVHAKFIGDVYCGSWNEAMEDHLAVVWAYEGDGMSRMAFMYPCLTLQDRFNDFMNAAAEVFDYGWPAKWIEGDEGDGDAVQDQRSEPWNVYTKKLPSNVTELKNLFYQEPYPELPDSFIKHIQFISGQLAQFILGSPPALFGGSEAKTDTAAAYAQARDQAMGVIGPVWMQMQRLWAQIYYQAALAAGQNPSYPETLVVPAEGGKGQELRPQRMQKGRFGCYPDKDTGFPETQAAKRQMLQAFLTLIGQNPVALQAFLQLPSNWELFKDIMGVPGIDFVQAAQEEKEARETEELLKNKPIPPSPQMLEQAQVAHAAQGVIAAAQGQPVQPFDPQSLEQSSVDIDPIFDYHQFAWEYWQRWTVENADKLTAEGKQDEVRNARLHALQHKQIVDQMAALQAQAAMPPPAPAKPPAPAPKPGVAPQPPGQSQTTLG